MSNIKKDKEDIEVPESGSWSEAIGSGGKGFSRILYCGIFLTGMAIISMEVSLTRVFSIALWHHFAFLSIAVALFGIGVSGVFLTVYPGILMKELYKFLSFMSWGLSFTTILSVFIFCRMDLDVRNLWNLGNLTKFGLFYLLLSVPFFCGGVILSTVMSRCNPLAQKIYFWDLLGTGSGCLVVAFLLSWMGAEGVIIVSAILSSLAGLIFSLKIKEERERKKRGVYFLLYIVLLMVGLIFGRVLFPIPLPGDKALYHYTVQKGVKVSDSIWNSFSRVDAFGPLENFALWGLSKNYQGEIPVQIGITIDGDGYTPIIKWDGKEDNMEKIEFPRWTLNSMVHGLNRGGDVLIIGSGGGIDMISSLGYGNGNIDAVEINPTILKLATEKYRDFSGDLYYKEGINFYPAEGRNFIKRTKKEYGLVYLPLVDSWAATYSGAYALSENFLYTKEAFGDYYSHVMEGGLVSISRWEYKMPHQPYQTYRLCVLAMDATGKDLRDSVVITSSGNLVNFIMKKGRFTEDELKYIKEFCLRCEFDINYMPGMKNDFTLLLDPAKWGDFIKNYPLDISVVSDDRPFFYLTDKWEYFWIYLDNSLKKGIKFPVVFTIVSVVGIMSLLFSVVFILLPLGIRGGKGLEGGVAVGYMIYFGLLGMGFMFLEMVLLQKFILFLGHPVYSLTVILFSLLVFTGVGSYLGGLYKGERKSLLGLAIGSLWVLGLIYYWLLDGIFAMSLGWDIGVRIIMSLLMLSPVGLCLGIPFPTGLRSLGEYREGLVPWGWGVNGVFSVVGSVCGLIFAQAMGFRGTWLCSLIMYGVAWWVFWGLEAGVKEQAGSKG